MDLWTFFSDWYKFIHVNHPTQKSAKKTRCSHFSFQTFELKSFQFREKFNLCSNFICPSYQKYTFLMSFFFVFFVNIYFRFIGKPLIKNGSPVVSLNRNSNEMSATYDDKFLFCCLCLLVSFDALSFTCFQIVVLFTSSVILIDFDGMINESFAFEISRSPGYGGGWSWCCLSNA